jgi:hypothetical protein
MRGDRNAGDRNVDLAGVLSKAVLARGVEDLAPGVGDLTRGVGDLTRGVGDLPE